MEERGRLGAPRCSPAAEEGREGGVGPPEPWPQPAHHEQEGREGGEDDGASPGTGPRGAGRPGTTSGDAGRARSVGRGRCDAARTGAAAVQMGASAVRGWDGRWRGDRVAEGGDRAAEGGDQAAAGLDRARRVDEGVRSNEWSGRGVPGWIRCEVCRRYSRRHRFFPPMPTVMPSAYLLFLFFVYIKFNLFKKCPNKM